MKITRHGEILFVPIDKKPTGLKKANQKEFLKGSHGNPHSFDNGTLYLKDENEFVFGYFVAKNTKLYHSEHSPKGAKLPDGIYELRRQVEYIADGLRPVVD